MSRNSFLLRFVDGKSRQGFCVCCFQLPTPGGGSGLLGTQLHLLQALPALGKLCLLRPHHRDPSLWQGWSQAGARPTSLKLQQELQTSQGRAQAAGAGKQQAEIRGSQLHRNLHPELCAKARWKKQCLQNTLSTAEPEQTTASQVCAAHQCTATNSKQRCKSSLSSLEFIDSS